MQGKLSVFHSYSRNLIKTVKEYNVFYIVFHSEMATGPTATAPAAAQGTTWLEKTGKAFLTCTISSKIIGHSVAPC